MFPAYFCLPEHAAEVGGDQRVFRKPHDVSVWAVRAIP